MKPFILSPGSKHTILTRIAFIIGLCIILLLSGLIALSATATRTIATGRNYTQDHVRSAKVMTLHIDEQATPSSTPDATPSPTAGPTMAAARLMYSQQIQTGPQVNTSPIYQGNSKLQEIALTFDDGPNPPYTQQVLAILQRYGVKATFFSIGSQAQAYPDSVRQEYAAGNVVGNHTWSHPLLTSLSGSAINDQLSNTSNAIAQATGVKPTLFRPPYGSYNSQVLTDANQLGLSAVLWDVDPQDWAMPGTSAITTRVLAQVHNGSIILMHDGGGDRSETVAALPTIIETLQQRGYHFVTVPQLISDLSK